MDGWTAKELGNDQRSEVIWTVVEIHTIPLLIFNFCTAHPINNTSCSYLHFASLFSHHFTFSQPVNAERISWDGCSRNSSVLARTLVILAYIKPTFPLLPPSFLHATLDLYFPVNYFEFSTFLLINKWGYSSPFFLFTKPWMLLSIYLTTKNMTWCG